MTEHEPSRPTIGITMGDPGGIGPEIVVKALAGGIGDVSMRVYGSLAVLEEARRSFAPDLEWQADANRSQDPIVVVDGGHELGPSRTPNAEAGVSSFEALQHAIIDAKRPDGDPARIDAIVTAPISKTSWHLADIEYPGHTEVLAEAFGNPPHAMMFVGPSLRVVLVTIHMPLAQVSGSITTEGVREMIELAHAACIDLGDAHPRLGVCGLNPHAGEYGLLGPEDDAIIKPAVAEANAAGIGVVGPLPADALFVEAANGTYDCVIAMYHDQGLIPIKLIERDHAVNVTIGLPVIRTSPAHGTAFDIAGEGIARPDSMIAAISHAARAAIARSHANRSG